MLRIKWPIALALAVLTTRGIDVPAIPDKPVVPDIPVDPDVPVIPPILDYDDMTCPDLSGLPGLPNGVTDEEV